MTSKERMMALYNGEMHDKVLFMNHLDDEIGTCLEKHYKITNNIPFEYAKTDNFGIAKIIGMDAISLFDHRTPIFTGTPHDYAQSKKGSP